MDWKQCSECKKCGMPIYHKLAKGKVPKTKKMCSCGPEVIIREYPQPYYPWRTPIYPTYIDFTPYCTISSSDTITNDGSNVTYTTASGSNMLVT